MLSLAAMNTNKTQAVCVCGHIQLPHCQFTHLLTVTSHHHNTVKGCYVAIAMACNPEHTSMVGRGNT